MNKNLKWYIAIVVSIIVFIFYIGYFFTDIGRDLEADMLTSDLDNTEKAENKLPIPPILEDKNPEEGKAEFDLKVQYGKSEFIEGYETNTLGYNGDYLGPIIKVNKGEDVKINVDNTLKNPTTVHWHGLEVPAEMDGGPHQVVEPNSKWEPYFTIDQPAATLWYHPHLLHKTGEQVYKGLAGLFYIEDEVSKKLDIPKEHGVNDIPLVVQDKRLTDNGDIPYELSMRDVMNGFLGDTVLINGAVNPELDVKNEVIRLRLLNGSNARAYEFNFSNNIEFNQIASDGGFLEEPVKMDKVSLAPAERAEVLLDLSDYKVGDKIKLRDGNYNLMTINIVEDVNKTNEIPENLVEIEDYNRDEVEKRREFVMSGMGPMVSINGKQMNMDRIDERLNLNELEEWTITNDSAGMGMMNSTPHPFHVHGVQFRIIERNGRKPPLNERGWKDTVMLDNGEEVKILAKFRKEGLFMYHCHILEHEDAGMMGQFLVE
ncbi:multicopper oxidase family protein [Senegalia massiliensis]|uniref:multicopper oxidase family protein n=1 Tax=Senegalia massiliensis TaxID=1720316 RepID=UPI001030F798|nr:multicopper oxidase domain-containing protein [Senegalia massiliensis]